MTESTFDKITRFLRELAEAAATPSGDVGSRARGSYLKPAPRDRM
jgi:hypothetical protein